MSLLPKSENIARSLVSAGAPLSIVSLLSTNLLFLLRHVSILASLPPIPPLVKRLRPYLSVLRVLPPLTQLDFEIKAKCNVNDLNFGLFSFIIGIANES